MSRVPDHIIERVHLGEATAAERALVEGDGDARARLAALPESDAAVLARHPVAITVRAIEDRARVHAARREAPSRGGSVVAIAGPLALAAVAVLFVAIAGDAVPPSELAAPGVDVTTPKGSTRLLVYRQRDEGAERLPQGAVAVPGDQLQLSVVAAGAKHGVIVSVDGRGSVTLHWPESAGASTRLKSVEHRLPHGYRLDDAPRFERFFLVTSDDETDVQAVVAAAEALAATGAADQGDLELPGAYSQLSTLVRKVN